MFSTVHGFTVTSPSHALHAAQLTPGSLGTMGLFSDCLIGGNPKKFRENLFAPGTECINAFELVEIDISVKGWSANVKDEINPATGKAWDTSDLSPHAKGYGMGIDAIRPLFGATLYSVHEHLSMSTPRSVNEAQKRIEFMRGRNSGISEMIPRDKAAFYVPRVSPSVRIEHDMRPEIRDQPEQISLFDWFHQEVGEDGAGGEGDASQCIDILAEHAMHFTNTRSVEAACKVLSLAAAAGALSVLALHNPYRKGPQHLLSPLSGVPLIDSRRLLRCVDVDKMDGDPQLDETGNYYAFKAGFKLPLPDSLPPKACKKQVCDEDDEDEGGTSESDDGSVSGKETGCDAVDFPMRDQEPLFLVSKEAFWGVKGQHNPQCPDFMLVDATSGTVNQLDWAHYLRVVHPVLQHNYVVVAAYLNMKTPEIKCNGNGCCHIACMCVQIDGYALFLFACAAI